MFVLFRVFLQQNRASHFVSNRYVVNLYNYYNKIIKQESVVLCIDMKCTELHNNLTHQCLLPEIEIQCVSVIWGPENPQF